MRHTSKRRPSIKHMQPSDSKSAFTLCSEAVANYLERRFLKSLQLLGERRALRFARLVAPLFTLSKNGQRLQNLEQFYGPTRWKKERRREFEKGYYNYLARLFAEQACLLPGPRERFQERVSLSGLEHLEEALRAGRGAMIVSGHVGNYRFIPAALGRGGYNVTALVRSAPLAGNERYFAELAAHYNARIVFTYQNVVEAFRTALQNNGIVYVAFETVALDNSPTWFPFGHSSLELSRGPAVLACRHRVPVLYGVAPQQADGRTAISLKPAESSTGQNGSALSPDQLVAGWLRDLHEDIVRYPEQWWEWPFQSIRANNDVSAELTSGSFINSFPGSKHRGEKARASVGQPRRQIHNSSLSPQTPGKP